MLQGQTFWGHITVPLDKLPLRISALPEPTFYAASSLSRVFLPTCRQVPTCLVSCCQKASIFIDRNFMGLHRWLQKRASGISELHLVTEPCLNCLKHERDACSEHCCRSSPGMVMGGLAMIMAALKNQPVQVRLNLMCESSWSTRIQICCSL